MSPGPRPRTPASLALTALAAVTAVLAACGGATSVTPTPSPTPARVATFSISVAEPISAAWQSVASAVTDTCRTPATGPWSYRYTALAADGMPSLDIQLILPDGAATAAGSGRFRLDLSPGESTGLPVWMVDPEDILSESHGTTGAITVTLEADGARIHLEGLALARGTDDPAVLPPGGGFQPLTVDVVCPPAR
jgi:hypothetical protein